MRVVTWNMNYWQQRAFHDDAWRWLVDELRPDVALVQECVPPAWLRDTHSVVFDRAYPVGDQSWGSALVTRGLRAREVRLDALEDWFAKLPPGDAWSLQRLASWGACAEVELVGGATLLVVSIHSSHRAIEPARLAGVDVEPVKLKLANGVWMLDVLFHFLKARLDRPLLVGGDFNYSRLLDDPKPRGNGEFFDRVARDGFVSVHRKFHDADEQTHFIEGRRPHQLDYLYADASVAALATSCNVVDYEPVRRFSDHAPIVAEIAVPRVGA